MLNAIATGLIAYLLRQVAVPVAGSNNIGTKPIAELRAARASSLIPDSSAARSTASSSSRSLAGVAYSVRARPHPVRLRPARDRALGVGRRRQRRQRQADDRHPMLLSGAVAGLVGMPDAARRRLHLQPGLPGRARVHRHRDRAARPQPPGRHRVRRAALGLPRRRRQPAADPRGRLQGDRRRSCRASSCCRVVDRLRAGPALSASRRSSAGSARELAAADRRPAGRRRCRHDRTSSTTAHRPTPPSAAALGAARPCRWSLLDVAGACRAGLAGPRRSPAPTTSRRAGRCAPPSRLAVPIGLAGLGGLWSERAGVVNIGLEGMMILGTWCAGLAGYQWGPWAGVLFGVVCGALGGLLHAVATVTFGVDHIVSGVAINILAPGHGAVPRRRSPSSGKPGGGSTQSPHDRGPAGAVTFPAPSDFLATSRTTTGSSCPTSPRVLRAVTVGVSAADGRSRSRCSWRPSTSCGAPRSACGCGRAARTRWRPSRSA